MSVEVGILEAYAPDSELENLLNTTNKLRESTMDFALQITDTVTMQEAVIKFKENKDLEDKWMDYMRDNFTPALNAIMERVKLKNAQICPGYADYLKSLQS